MIFRFLLTFFMDIFPSSFFAYRRLILRLMGIKVHPTAKVNSGFRIYGTGKLEIGSNTWIGRNCHFYTIGNCGIKIGSNTEIGPETMVNCQTHKIGTSEHRAGDCNNHPVEIGNGIWIGTRTTILLSLIPLTRRQRSTRMRIRSFTVTVDSNIQIACSGQNWTRPV